MTKTPFDPAKLALGDTVGASDMTVGEVITSFRQAKNRGVQLQVLADLAGCKPEDIRELLIAHGVSYKEMPRAKRAKHPVEVKPEDTEKFNQEAASENFRGGGGRRATRAGIPCAAGGCGIRDANARSLREGLRTRSCRTEGHAFDLFEGVRRCRFCVGDPGQGAIRDRQNVGRRAT